MRIVAVTNTKYKYVSVDGKVKVILVNNEGGAIRISGDIASQSRPGMWHHAEIIINNDGWVRFSCSCEAGAHGFLCHHVAELYNVYRKNFKKLLTR
ncbi:hypothetical protein STK_13442 [Sulfurisphaera tokodaii str. 7]|uniref:SWIM-type domain-containing protein n=1 Tax=Sulfurisphaera tokodaii (strain DSM 16993 / JCM 10545 / NBRC 100140 / 7) TaxID=273063 RepID=Q971L6_SULTO|nr:hypothetical protein [Sulfurisphaera tokodaii]BAB66404.1 hypothetical protein STK_13442 [Sulfurisphaera tokodaii str. 7]